MKFMAWTTGLLLAVACGGAGKGGGSDTVGGAGSDGGGSDGATDGATDGGSDGGNSDQGWCAVQGIFNSQCVSCHSAAGHLGDLDLETDPYAALVGVPSASYPGRTLVVAGDSANSFLLVKMLGEQSADEGSVMPTSGALPAEKTALVEAWISAGATSDCTDPGGDTGAPSTYHPAGFADPGVHGIEAKFQTQV